MNKDEQIASLQRELQAAKQDSELLRNKLANAEEWIVKQQDALKRSNASITQHMSEKLAMNEKINALLAHCPDPECHTCAKIACPKGHPFHFHHDGCPVCGDEDDAAIKAAQAGRAG